MYATLLAVLGALLLWPDWARAQSAAEPASSWLVTRPLQRIYSVPPSWQTAYARTDSLSIVSYRSPDLETMLWVAAVPLPAQGRALPGPALHRVLRYVGVHGFRPTYTTERGLDYLEGTGTCWRAGRELRYDVRVLNDEGHHLLVFLHLTPMQTAFPESALPVLLRQLTPPALYR